MFRGRKKNESFKSWQSYLACKALYCCQLSRESPPQCQTCGRKTIYPLPFSLTASHNDFLVAKSIRLALQGWFIYLSEDSWGLLRIFIQVELFPEKRQKFSWTMAVTAMRKVTKEQIMSAPPLPTHTPRPPSLACGFENHTYEPRILSHLVFSKKGIERSYKYS